MADTDYSPEWLAKPPGSLQARKAGCICPVMDNGHGKGCFGNGFKYGWWTNSACPLHGTKAND